MKNFYIITNKTKDLEEKVTHEVISIINAAGCNVTGSIFSLSDNDTGNYTEVAKNIPSETEAIVVLGGDGTMLRAARYLYTLNIPFIGINLGHLGYLTEGNECDIKNIFEKILSNNFVVEDRMLISGIIYNNASKADLSKNIALNDITLTRNNSLKIISFKLYVNGSHLYTYTADGIVISTPTGSTAYNLSLGGPIATPTSKLILITPIAPHALNNRSLVLSAEDEIEIELIGADSDKSIEYKVFFDGDTSVNISPNEIIKIAQEKLFVKLIRLSSESFLETLKEKMR